MARIYWLSLDGKQRIPKRIVKSKLAQTIPSCKEWWQVEAPTIAAARALVALWPNRASDVGLQARVLNHARNR